MFSRISEKIIGNMTKNGTIEDEDKELYLFGVQQGFTILLNLVTTIAVGLMFGILWQTILFMTAYIPLRSFAGGYHSSTPQRCYVLSTLLLTVSAMMFKYINLNIYILLILVISASITIFALSPIENKNKPLDEIEKRMYRKKTITIFIFEIFTVVVFLLLDLSALAFNVIWAVIICAAMLILEKVKI